MTRKHRTEYFDDPVNRALDSRRATAKIREVFCYLPQPDRGSLVVLNASAKVRDRIGETVSRMKFEKKSENGPIVCEIYAGEVLRELSGDQSGDPLRWRPIFQGRVSI